MVTRAQLDKLTQRIEALAPRRSDTGFAVVFARPGEDEAAAEARHYREHPEDSAKSGVIVVRFVAARDGRPAESFQSD